MEGQATFVEVDAQLLTAYVRAIERARQAREERAGALTAVGSAGQVVAHPLLRVEREAESDARDLAGLLLLTPAARKRFELEVQSAGGRFDGRF